MSRPPDPRSDQQLVAAINAGENDAFEVLYFRYRDWVVRLAWRFTRNEADALDVLQETFAYVAGKFPGFKLTAAMTSFLYPVVKNLSLAAKKKSQRFAGESQAAATVMGATASDDLTAALGALSDLHRDVILLRFVDDLSLQEIADALNIPLGTVKSRLHHAIETLRNDERAKEFFLP